MQRIYFAYGSNLWFARLHIRCPSITKIGMGRLPQHRLSFDKPGGDNSGKCGIESVDGQDSVIGVLYKMTLDDKLVLDRIEGEGHDYHEEEVVVHSESGPVDCFTYYPSRLDEATPPWDWYKGFVLEGAKQNQFPPAYVQMIDAVSSMVDPDSVRRAENLAILEQRYTSGHR
ncbi:MAG: gamma-glutamylcyclotransferase [Acidiferrobacterales bacterium]|nr:gamma-glutamylcyclotransferase [Acidiferrobacterales bacterium]